MDLGKINFSLVRYSVAKCQISSPNLKSFYTVPAAAIGGIVIENGYEEFNFPFFTIDIELPAYVIRAIKKSPFENRLFLSLKAGFYDSVDGDGTMEPSATSTYIDDKFMMILEDQNISLYDSDVENFEEKEGYDYKNVNAGSNDIMKFSLYKEDQVEASLKIINDIIVSGNAASIQTYILNKAGIRNVCASPPTINTRYNQFILPPYNALEHLERLAIDYGIHKNGTLIYFGLDRTYIIEKDTKCTAYSTNEFKITYICYSTDKLSSVFNAGCCKSARDKVNYVILQPDGADFGSAIKNNEWSIGSNVNIISSDTKTIHYGDRNNGKFYIGGNIDAVKRQIDSCNSTPSFAFRNCDLMMFTPNKQFIVSIDDQKYKRYNEILRITKCNAVLVKEGELFTPFVFCEFVS